MILTKIFLYLIIKPLSHLPFEVLYFLSGGLFFVVYGLIGYRKKIVMTNLRNSFPERDEKELKKISKKFYRHFCNLIVETIKIGGMTKKEALKRCTITNPEVLDEYFDQGRSLIAIGGHYSNWEILAVVQPLFTKHLPLGIYSSLANPTIDEFMINSRERFGMEMVPKRKTPRKIEAYLEDNPFIIYFLSDQCPKNPRRAYWTRFLNQDTAIPYGAGAYAIKYNLPVVYGKMEKVKNGYFNLTFKILEPDPTQSTAEQILEKFSQNLEAQIIEKPEHWLWSHRRWKRKKPEDLQ